VHGYVASQGYSPEDAGPGSGSDGLCPACLLRLALIHTGSGSKDDGEPKRLLDNWFGPCRTLQILDEGRMGMVYLTEQQRPIRRQVALPTIPAMPRGSQPPCAALPTR